MVHKMLFPHKCKLVGWIILIPATIFGIMILLFGNEDFPIHANVFAVYSSGFSKDNVTFSFLETNIRDTLAASLFIIGALLVGFSKEKHEDEFIARLRLSSILWAVFINYVLLLLAIVFIYGFAFFDVMLYNMFTMLIIFIVRFNFLLYRNNKSLVND